MALNDVTALIPLEEEDEEIEDMEDMPLEIEDEEEVTEMSFPIPEGFAPPDNVVDGGVFDAHITARIQNGRIIIDSINNSKVAVDPSVVDVTDPDVASEDALNAAMAQSGFDPFR